MVARAEVTGRKTGRRLLDYQAIRARGIPWSRVHLARLEAAGKFPLHIDVGENSIAWFEDEIDDLLEAKARVAQHGQEVTGPVERSRIDDVINVVPLL